MKREIRSRGIFVLISIVSEISYSKMSIIHSFYDTWKHRNQMDWRIDFAETESSDCGVFSYCTEYLFKYETNSFQEEAEKISMKTTELLFVFEQYLERLFNGIFLSSEWKFPTRKFIYYVYYYLAYVSI